MSWDSPSPFSPAEGTANTLRLLFYTIRSRQTIPFKPQFILKLNPFPSIYSGKNLDSEAKIIYRLTKGNKAASDQRILGSSEFVEGLLSEVDEREKETLRLSVRVRDLGLVAEEIKKGEGVGESELRSGRRERKVSRGRRLFCQLAVGKMGYPGAEVARFLGVTTSAVIRAAYSEELPELPKYL